jgi:hypothetical protein
MTVVSGNGETTNSAFQSDTALKLSYVDEHIPNVREYVNKFLELLSTNGLRPKYDMLIGLRLLSELIEIEMLVKEIKDGEVIVEYKRKNVSMVVKYEKS